MRENTKIAQNRNTLMDKPPAQTVVEDLQASIRSNIDTRVQKALLSNWCTKTTAMEKSSKSWMS